MKLVVDSNVLFTFFWKDSAFKSIILKKNFELFSPESSLEEIKKYTPVMMKKTDLSLEEFKIIKMKLALKVNFMPAKEYSTSFKKAENLVKNFDERQKIEFLADLDFFALALELHLPIWSNDNLFKKQPEVIVL